MNALTPHAMLQVPQSQDIDPEETAEWRDAFLALVATQGPERARRLLQEIVGVARAQRVGWQPDLNTPYVNTVAVQEQGVFPGDLAIEERLGSIIRWNALAMVVRANWAMASTGAIWCSSSRTARPACMRGRFSKGASPSRI